ncbi:MAG: 6-phosphogluconolactonase [Winogradskyella sp.]|nr:6-phosphogluconolactonase [Winogradskyella sp.]
MQLVTIDAEKYIDFAASSILQKLTQLLKTKNDVFIALSGGSSPLPIYKKLSTCDIEWKRLHFFMVDERCVPSDHEESNYKNISDNLFNHVQTNTYPAVCTNLDFEKSAKTYDRLLKEKLGVEKGFPKFDLIILGMGLDGHTASLFPETKALQNTKDSYVLNSVPQLKALRLTMTYPVILNAQTIILLVPGLSKKKVLTNANNNSLPIAKVLPSIDLIIN